MRDALAARSLLDVIFTHDLPATRADLAAALAIDRTNVLVRLWIPVVHADRAR